MVGEKFESHGGCGVIAALEIELRSKIGICCGVWRFTYPLNSRSDVLYLSPSCGH